MLGNLKRQWQRRMLKDPRYATLFVDDTQEVVSVDCETTSLKVQEAELLSIGAVKLRGNRILSSQSFYVLVKPTRKLESRNISIHGLRPMDVSEGLDADDAVRQLLDFIGGRPLVGYYLEYDVAVLNKYVRGITGISLPNRQIEVPAAITTTSSSKPRCLHRPAAGRADCRPASTGPATPRRPERRHYRRHAVPGLETAWFWLISVTP
jgi:DNA polymerase-3 subunit epsilon